MAGGGGVTRVEAIEAGIPKLPSIARVKSKTTPMEGKVLDAWRTPSIGGIVLRAGVCCAATAEPQLHTSGWGG